MSLGKVDDVDEVTLACTVRSWIIISEDAQALPPADGSLGDERHEIVRHATRKLSDEG